MKTSPIKLKRLGAGEYYFENENYQISISFLEDSYGRTNNSFPKMWFADVYKKHKDGSLTRYNHIDPTYTLGYMKDILESFVNN